MKVNHFLLTLLYSNVIFSHVHFSDKLKPLRVGPYKILDRLSMLQMNYPHKMVPHYTFKETTLFLIIQKNHTCTLIFAISCGFQTQPIITIQNQLNTQIVIPSVLIPMLPYLTTIHHKTNLPIYITNYITDFPSKNNSFIKLNDHPPFKPIIKTPQQNLPDR